MFKVLKIAWTVVVNVGWMAVLGVCLSKADPYGPSIPARGVDSPSQNVAASSTEVIMIDPPIAAASPEPDEHPASKTFKLPTTAEMMATIQAEVDRNAADRVEADLLKERVARDAKAREIEPHWVQPRLIVSNVVPCPTPNLHETHEPGEPYAYSLARCDNNKLRWTINEFRWRLKDPMHDHTRYWDLSDIDGPRLDASLPADLAALQKQNWDLSWRASQLVAIFNNEPISEAEHAPPMPKGIVRIPIPTPNCNSDFCRVR